MRQKMDFGKTTNDGLRVASFERLFSGICCFALVLCFTGCSSYPETSLTKHQQETFGALVQSYKTQAENSSLSTTDISSKAPQDNSDELKFDTKDPLLSPRELQKERKPINLGLVDLYLRAVEHSSQMKVFSDLPLIRGTSMQEAKGMFDLRLFADIRHYDRDDPIGSTLTTGGEGRFLEEDTRFSAGVRKKTLLGSEVYIYEEINYTTNNSEYFQPNPQAGARLVVGVVQPLLKGAGRRYNISPMEVASIDTEMAQKELLRQTEAHLLEIARTYWGLYMARGTCRAKERAYMEADAILQALESRGNFDAVKTQILRTKAVTAERRAELVRAENAILNAEERIKALVNDPEFLEGGALEFIPSDLPDTSRASVDMESALKTALARRPEIHQAYLQLRAAAVRLEMSRHERLPSLDLFLEGYLAGLERDDIGGAWDDQFDDDGPGYMIGLRLERAFGANQAKAVNMRRRLELRQLQQQLKTTIESVSLDVRISVREVDTAFRDFAAKWESMNAAREEYVVLKQKQDAAFLDGGAKAVEYLDRLLDSQAHQAASEEKMMRALSIYNVAQVALKRSQCSLLESESLTFHEVNAEDDSQQRRRFIETKKMPALVLQRNVTQEPADDK